MALTKTISSNGSRNHHKFTLKVTEDRTEGNNSYLSFTFTLSPVVKGYDWSGWGSRISYSISIGSNTYTGTIPSYNGSSTVTLKSANNIEIEHNNDGTKSITVSFSVSDTASQSYTPGNASASDTFVLSTLHTPPSITNIAIAETNTTLTGLSIANNLIVQYLSKKQFTITASMYDSATLSSCKIYHNDVLIGTSSSNVLTINFNNVGELVTTQSSGNYYVTLNIVVTDSLSGTSTQSVNYQVIKYFKPTIDNSATTIKRKTGNGVVLTDNKVNLNFVGTTYKTNDTIGNNNNPSVKYKIWNTTEPASYTSISSTVSGNNVTITNYEISNIIYTSVYSYKIKITDSFGNSSEKEGTISTGTSVWTEYKDRVDFLKVQVGGVDVLTQDDMFYKENDVVELGSTTSPNLFIISGYLTSSKQKVFLSLQLPKHLTNINTVTVNKLTIEARGISGYLNNTSDFIEYVGKSGYTIDAEIINENTIVIILEKSSEFTNVSNNTPVVADGYIKLILT